MPATSDETAAQTAAAAEQAGISVESFTELRVGSVGSNVVLADTNHRVVARVAPTDTPAVASAAAETLRAAVAAAAADAPVLAPLEHTLSRLQDGRPVTFWPMADPPGEITPQDMAHLAARLHQCAPPAELPGWDPTRRTTRKRRQLEAAATNTSIPRHYTTTLTRRWGRCEQALKALAPTRAEVIVHDDLHPGNVVRWHGELMLCDLDSLCRGPREADLAKAVFHFDRFRTEVAGAQVLAAYSRPFDADTVGALRGVSEVSACVWLASLWNSRPDTRPELRRRVETLDDPTARWATV